MSTIQEVASREIAESAYRTGWHEEDRKIRGLPPIVQGPRQRDAAWEVWFLRGAQDRRQTNSDCFDQRWIYDKPSGTIIDGDAVGGPPPPLPEDPRPIVVPAPVVVAPAQPVNVAVSSGLSWWAVGVLVVAAAGGGYALGRSGRRRAEDRI